jgi:predicted regulator of Ras-like GTPase activity (Roadblock/LC7/MglB family)
MAKHPNVSALIAFSPDGLVISSQIQSGQDKEQISALSAMLLKDAMKATNSFNFGEFKRILLVSEKGYLTVLNVTEEIKVAMLCSERSVFMKAFKDLAKIAETL